MYLFNKEKELDNWEGRWPTNYEPSTYTERVIANRLDILANNEKVVLDIGMRYIAESNFQGWDNSRYIDFGGQQRRIIPPGNYGLKVVLASSNSKKSNWFFMLNIPDEPQIDDFNQVQIKQFTKRALRKAGFWIR